jgi:hypothetical protein
LLLIWAKKEGSWLSMVFRPIQTTKNLKSFCAGDVAALYLGAAFAGTQPLFERAGKWPENPEALREWMGAPEALPEQMSESPG